MLCGLMIGCVTGAVMLKQFGVLSLLASTSLSVMTDEHVEWVILVCGLMSCMIGLMIRIGTIFLVMGFVSFAIGSNWGVFVIILPIVSALGSELNADMVIGVTLSASTFGSHACFYSDATVLTGQAFGCTPFQHALTQLRYALLAAGISCVGYLLVA